MQEISSSINLDLTINSGQVFLWERVGKSWMGIDGNRVLGVSEEPFRIVSSSGRTNNFFREDDDMKRITREISRDRLVASAVKKFSGLRLMRQDPFQCYVSFICSSNSSIQNIQHMLRNLCKKFGEKVEFEKKEFFVFPSPERLAKANIRELLSCGLGFRAKYVRGACQAVSSGRINLESLRRESYHSARDILKTIYGIGNKVADCILLFSLDKLESFPLDRWMQRILQQHYQKLFHEYTTKSLTEKRYSELHDIIVQYFGSYAGYSQQFLFKMERDLNKKRWL